MRLGELLVRAEDLVQVRIACRQVQVDLGELDEARVEINELRHVLAPGEVAQRDDLAQRAPRKYLALEYARDLFDRH